MFKRLISLVILSMAMASLALGSAGANPGPDSSPPVYVPVGPDGVRYEPEELNRISHDLYGKTALISVGLAGEDLGAFTTEEKYNAFAAQPGLSAQERPGRKRGPWTPAELERFAVPDTTPHLNVADPANPNHGKVKLPTRARKGFPVPGEADFGAFINEIVPEGTNPGGYAYQEVNTSVSLPAAPPDRFLYAPTLQAPNMARLEAVTTYWRRAGEGTTTKAFGVYDHKCGTGSGCPWVVFKFIDRTFLDTYTRGCTAGSCYEVIVQKYSDGWRVYLFNYNTFLYELQVTRPHDPTALVIGWNAWESFFGGTCPTLPRLESLDLEVWTTTGWQDVTPTYGSVLNNMMCPYSMGWVFQYYSWWVGP